MKTVKLPAALFLVVALAAPAAAQQSGALASPPGAESVVRPNWRNRPTAYDLVRYYPKEGAGRVGEAMVRCLVDEEGRLSSCEIVREAPEGHGFGTATIALARLFRLDPIDGDGRPVAGRYQYLPVKWYPPR
jgi:TonB family protein